MEPVRPQREPRLQREQLTQDNWFSRVANSGEAKPVVCRMPCAIWTILSGGLDGWFAVPGASAVHASLAIRFAGLFGGGGAKVMDFDVD